MAKIEEVIKMVYKIFREKQNKDNLPHPDEEMLVNFCEGRLSKEDYKAIQEHLLRCEHCAEAVSLYNLKVEAKRSVPEFLIKKAKDLVKEKTLQVILEIILSIKEKALEIINTTGDVILGNEVIPLPVLRSRQIRALNEEMTVVKEFQDIRINVNIEKKDKDKVKICIFLSDKDTARPLSDLRVSLLKDDIELESYMVDSGKATFDKVAFGKYELQISQRDKDLGSIKLQII